MEYQKILKQAWQITKQNKILWIFGLFLGGAGGFNFNFSGGGGSEFDDYGLASEATNWLNDNWYIVAILIGLFLLVFLFFFIISSIFRGGFYKGAELASQNKKLKFKELWLFGWRNFWRLLGLSVLWGLLILAAVIAVLMPGILLLLIPVIGRVLGALLIIAGILLIIILVFVATVVGNYANCYLLLAQDKIIQAITKGWNLFKRNLADSIVMALLIFLIGIAATIVLFIVILILALPFVALGLAAYAMVGWIGVGIIAFLGASVLVLVGWTGQAALNTYSGIAWVLAWQELEQFCHPSSAGRATVL